MPVLWNLRDNPADYLQISTIKTTNWILWITIIIPMVTYSVCVVIITTYSDRDTGVQDKCSYSSTIFLCAGCSLTFQEMKTHCRFSYKLCLNSGASYFRGLPGSQRRLLPGTRRRWRPKRNQSVLSTEAFSDQRCLTTDLLLDTMRTFWCFFNMYHSCSVGFKSDTQAVDVSSLASAFTSLKNASSLKRNESWHRLGWKPFDGWKNAFVVCIWRRHNTD